MECRSQATCCLWRYSIHRSNDWAVTIACTIISSCVGMQVLRGVHINPDAGSHRGREQIFFR